MNASNLKLLAGSLAIALLATPAFAKQKIQTGDSGVEKELRFKEGDENGNEMKALKTEMLVIKSEKKALEQLQALHKKHVNTRMEPEIIFRLAELYMRRARSERFFEVHKGNGTILSFVPQSVKEAGEAAEIRKAISHYARIQERFPRFHAMDTVLFNNAYAFQQVGDPKGAEALYLKLVQSYPFSMLVPDAYLSLGEINYVARNFTVALEHFQKIRKFPKSRVYPYGLYKSAWSYYNLQDAESGMKQLEEVIKYGQMVAANKWDSKLDLRKEALGDLALFYGDTKKADGAVEYFMAQAAELDASTYVMRLVELYKRHSSYKEIELVLKDILTKMPQSEAVPSAHEELVWNFERTKRQNLAVEQLASFDKYCEVNRTKLEVEFKKTSKKGLTMARTECENKISDTSKKLAAKWHGTWKKCCAPSGGEEIAASAEKSYRLYLKSSDPKDVEQATIRFAFAELLFARKQYREASEHYASIEGFQKAGQKLDAKVSHDAAYGAIVALEKAVNDKYNDADEKRFGELAEMYISRQTQGQYVLDLRFKRAFIAYEKERFDEAAPQFRKIGWDKYPAGVAVSEKVTKSQDLYLDILNHKKDFKTLKDAAQELLARAGTEGVRNGQIQKIYREAYFAEIQLLEEKGDLAAAVESYKKFALENAASELAPKAWWNASQLQFKMGDATGGANTCYQMHKLFPSSSNGKDCLTKAANTFEAMGRLELAARVLLNLAEVEADKSLHWREVAADFFALSGSKDRAITMYMKLAETAKGEKQVELLDRAATLARDSGDMKTVAQLEAQFTAKNIEPQASRLVVEQAEEAFEKNDLTKAFNLSKRVISRDSLPKDLLARARFVQARVLEDEYRKQSVKAKVERIGMVLALKTEKLEKAQKAYQSAIKYGDPKTSVSSLKRLANCYLDYAKTVRDMQLPASVAEADSKAFRAEIEQLSIPMEEKGIESMNQALETARKSQLRDGQIADLQTEVNRLNMKPTQTLAVSVIAPQQYLPQFRRDPAAATKEVVR